jgi:hypothetical protein
LIASVARGIACYTLIRDWNEPNRTISDAGFVEEIERTCTGNTSKIPYLITGETRNIAFQTIIA